MYNGYNVYSLCIDIVEFCKEIGMVFQQFNLFFMLVFENVVYGFRFKGIKDKVMLDEVVEILLKGVFIWDEVKDRLYDFVFGLFGG